MDKNNRKRKATDEPEKVKSVVRCCCSRAQYRVKDQPKCLAEQSTFPDPFVSVAHSMQRGNGKRKAQENRYGMHVID